MLGFTGFRVYWAAVIGFLKFGILSPYNGDSNGEGNAQQNGNLLYVRVYWFAVKKLKLL